MGLRLMIFTMLYSNGLVLWVSLVISWMTGRQFDPEFNKVVFVVFIPVYILGLFVKEKNKLLIENIPELVNK